MFCIYIILFNIYIFEKLLPFGLANRMIVIHW